MCYRGVERQHMNKPTQDVAVFIDFENIYVSVREKFDATPNFEALMERCEDYGRVVVARAYADWYRYPRITSALFANNIEPMYVPTYYYDKDEGRQGRPIKNSVDMHMCIDAMRTLYTRTNIDTFVFITGDRDFIALVNCVRQEGKDVVIVGIGGAASSHLAQSADEFLFYEQIVDIRPMGGRRNEKYNTIERADRADRADRGERERQLVRIERPERTDRSDRKRERDRDRGDRYEAPVDKTEKVEAKAEKAVEAQPEKVQEQSKPALPAPIVAIPTASGDLTAYDTLVEALLLARKRGYVTSFGSLKVLMKELMPNFKESRYRDQQGKPFSKFTDFVREAERLGKIQIFTSGTVNEVFLPDEDPYKLSQFAEDLPSVEAERELEQELAAEAQGTTIEQVLDSSTVLEDSVIEDVAEARSDRNGNGRRRRRRGSQQRTEPTIIEVSDEETTETESLANDEPESFGEREWNMFNQVMLAYNEPVPFADIFNDLREMRNTQEVSLTNNALKELIKQAINAGKVQRSNRGAKAHYRLIAPVIPDNALDLPLLSDQEVAALIPEADDAMLPNFEDEFSPPPAMVGGEELTVEPDYTAPDMVVSSPEDLLVYDPAIRLDVPTDEAPTEEPKAEAKPSKSRRKRQSNKTHEQPEAQSTETVEAVAPVVDEPAKPKRGGRRKKDQATAEPVVHEEAKPKTQRRRKKVNPESSEGTE